MKKFILTLLVFLTMLFTLTGCSLYNKDYEDYKPQQGSQFILIESYTDPYLGKVKILVDKNTRVMYMYITYFDDESDGRAITVLYDSDGNVRRYMGAISE